MALECLTLRQGRREEGAKGSLRHTREDKNTHAKFSVINPKNSSADLGQLLV